MPTSKKSTKNVVSTVDGYAKYKVQSNGIVKSLSKCGHFAPVNTIYNIFRVLFLKNEPSVQTTVFYGPRGVTTYTVSKNDLGGFSIGCNEFDAKTTRKFFRLVGVPNSRLNQYFPVAKGAAAGR